jgi:hypothetical protein
MGRVGATGRRSAGTTAARSSSTEMSNCRVRILFPNARERPARPDDRLYQPAGRGAIAKIQAVGHNPLDAQVLRQRTHHVLQSLADEHDVRTCLHQVQHLAHASLLQPRLQLV